MLSDPVRHIFGPVVLAVGWAGALAVHAQPAPRPSDAASPEAVVAATYEALQRPPGGAYGWEHSNALFLPQGIQIAANGDGFALFTPDVFARYVDSHTSPGAPGDPGFSEWEIHSVVHQYGDVAQVFSTYEKASWARDELLGRGVNAFQLVRLPEGQWRIVSVVWDEEGGAGPVPARYGGAGADTEPEPLPGPRAYASPLAIVEALYETVQRPPGGTYDWDRLRSLFLPQAVLIPNTEQRGGQFVVETPGAFIALVDSFTTIGGPNDRGFAEEQVHAVVEVFGDVAQVFSTYEKRFYDSPEILGRGVNSIQLVRHDGRWWIVGIAWDEENGAGPIPEAYLPR